MKIPRDPLADSAGFFGGPGGGFSGAMRRRRTTNAVHADRRIPKLLKSIPGIKAVFFIPAIFAVFTIFAALTMHDGEKGDTDDSTIRCLFLCIRMPFIYDGQRKTYCHGSHIKVQ